MVRARGANGVLQSENQGQIFANWNHYVRLLGERPDCLSSLFKLCVVGSSDGEFCGIWAKTCLFRVALVFRGGWWRELKCGQRSQFVAPERRWVIYSHCMGSGSNGSSWHTRPISMTTIGTLCWYGKLQRRNDTKIGQFILSQISVVVDLQEGLGLITQQRITNSTTLA